MAKQAAQTTHSLQVRGDWYHVRRRGSRYNIFGPDGRAFSRYESAGVAGPRWEELTRTPWPHPSSAYQPGLRLAQLSQEPGAPDTRRAGPAPLPPKLPLPAYDILKIRRVPLSEPVQERLQDPTIRALLERESSGSGPDARRARQALEAAAVAVDDAAFEIRQGSQAVAGPYATLLIARAVKVTLIARDHALLSDPAAALPLCLPAPRPAPVRVAEAPPPEPEAEREPERTPRLDRAERLRRNAQRNAQRAARFDARAILTQHVAWQAERSKAAISS